MTPRQRHLWVVVGIATITIVVGVLGFTRGHCWYYGWATGFETKYVPFVGCVAKGDDNRWLPLERFREVD